MALIALTPRSRPERDQTRRRLVGMAVGLALGVGVLWMLAMHPFVTSGQVECRPAAATALRPDRPNPALDDVFPTAAFARSCNGESRRRVLAGLVATGALAGLGLALSAPRLSQT
jgi:hypothetical protein